MPTFFRLQIGLLVASVCVPGVSYALVLTGAVDPLRASDVALPTLIGLWTLALATPFVVRSDASRHERFTAFILAWLAVAIVFPLIWDLPWALVHGWVDGATAEDRVKWFFWAYAVADTRFLKSDPVMIWVEYCSGLIAFLQIYALHRLWRGDVARACDVSIGASLLAIYGCGVLFGVEVLEGMDDIRPDALSYIKFWGLNGTWVVVPPIAGFLFLELKQDPRFDARRTIARLFGRPRAG
jgi:hypothetical protein